MTDKPIIFSGPMVRAILDDRKTQTRQVLKPQPRRGWTVWQDSDTKLWLQSGYGEAGDDFLNVPYQPGDRLFPAVEIPSLSNIYRADICGRIWSKSRGVWRLLKPGVNSRGYLTVTPAVRKAYPTQAVHRLVCEAFYGPVPEGLSEVRHLDGDNTNNAPNNLDWGTAEQNRQDRNAHGRVLGEDHPAAKLTAVEVEEIRSSTASQRQLAAQFGMSQSTIGKIKTGDIWKDSHPQDPPNLERWAKPCALYVTAVKVERLQEIGEVDAKAEGALQCARRVVGLEGGCPSYVCGFRQVWHQINAKREGCRWDDNPWGGAYTFKPIMANIDSLDHAA